MRDKIAFVCQRYGLEVNGGAELYCRQLAEKMRAVYDVEVYTTCALDYMTWENFYKPGVETIQGIKVRRFLNERTRDIHKFNRFGVKVLFNPGHSDEDESEWIDRQGPVCPTLVDEVYKRREEYRAVIFMTYLYYPTVRGLSMGFDNALFVPTLHDEKAAYLRCYDKVFRSAKGFIWLTPEEQRFAQKRFPFVRDMQDVMAGAGVDVPDGELPEVPEELRDADYIVYAGRIDEGKGCGDLFRYFRRYKAQYGGALKLALMGKAMMKIPRNQNIVNLGFVSEEMKFAVMRNAKALVLFSHFESLSMVVLESMAMSRPVLVNGKSEVLKGHCLRSNAGLYFDDYPEFAATLNYLLTHEAEYEIMRKNGKRYVEENYRWDAIVQRIQGLIETA